MRRFKRILANHGFPLSKEMRILDFGCGTGKAVYEWLDAGYVNVVGFDVRNYLALRNPEDSKYFHIAENDSGRLPFEDNCFDVVISYQVLEHVHNQVGILTELHRVMRTGACAIHEFPAQYSLIEPHFFVPFGGVIMHRPWYKLWALLGIRKSTQKGWSADVVADRNAYYAVEGLNYVSSSCYEVVWRSLSYKYVWINSDFYHTSQRKFVRLIGRINDRARLFECLDRLFFSRRVLLMKK